jgi:hypothetical protein
MKRAAVLALLLLTVPILVSAATFTRPLIIGSKGKDVSALQQILNQQGYLSTSSTGYFGSLTAVALKKFQTAHGIEALGGVGPKTRAVLNTLAAAPADKAALIASLLAQVKTLQAQIAALLAAHSATSTPATRQTAGDHEMVDRDPQRHAQVRECEPVRIRQQRLRAPHPPSGPARLRVAAHHHGDH